MTEGINLLPKQEEVITKKNRFSSFLQVTSVVALVVTAVATLAVFLLRVFSPLPSLQKEEVVLRSKLDTLAVTKVKYVETDNRLNAISKRLNERNEFHEVLSKVFEQATDDIIYQELEIDNNRSFHMTVISPSLKSIRDFMGKLTTAVNSNQIFSYLELSELAASEEGYSFEFTAVIL